MTCYWHKLWVSSLEINMKLNFNIADLEKQSHDKMGKRQSKSFSGEKWATSHLPRDWTSFPWVLDFLFKLNKMPQTPTRSMCGVHQQYVPYLEWLWDFGFSEKKSILTGEWATADIFIQWHQGSLLFRIKISVPKNLQYRMKKGTEISKNFSQTSY